MAVVIVCSDFGAPQNKVSDCFHCFPIYLLWSDWTKCHDLRFLNVEFKPDVSLSSFTFTKWLFSFSLLSAMRVVSSAYLRLLIFLPAIVISACASSSWAFRMIYSTYNLNKQGGNETLLVNHAEMPGFLTSGGEEFNLEPEMWLVRLEVLCNKVLFKYKGDRESFWHRHQQGAESVPPC